MNTVYNGVGVTPPEAGRQDERGLYFGELRHGAIVRLGWAAVNGVGGSP